MQTSENSKIAGIKNLRKHKDCIINLSNHGRRLRAQILTSRLHILHGMVSILEWYRSHQNLKLLLWYLTAVKQPRKTGLSAPAWPGSGFCKMADLAASIDSRTDIWGDHSFECDGA